MKYVILESYAGNASTEIAGKSEESRTVLQDIGQRNCIAR